MKIREKLPVRPAAPHAALMKVGLIVYLFCSFIKNNFHDLFQSGRKVEVKIVNKTNTVRRNIGGPYLCAMLVS